MSEREKILVDKQLFLNLVRHAEKYHEVRKGKKSGELSMQTRIELRHIHKRQICTVNKLVKDYRKEQNND